MAAAVLETFLGGMETVRGKARRPFGNTPLKPSLVEWKQVQGLGRLDPGASLKPSLVEWKRTEPSTLRILAKALETFLGGMETRGPSRRSCRSGPP